MANLDGNPSNSEPDNSPWNWRLRCPHCGAARWERVAEESLRIVFQCLSCNETGQVDLASIEERV